MKDPLKLDYPTKGGFMQFEPKQKPKFIKIPSQIQHHE
jgi:hypothetical protein